MDQIPDKILLKFVNKMMYEGVTENHWFETKRRLHPEQIKKLSKIITSISNTGGGIIYYGWDENKSEQVDIDIDFIQRLVVQHSNFCQPPVEIKFRSVFANSKKGLFVGIPAGQTIIKDKNNNSWYRSGSHVKPIDDAYEYSSNTGHLTNKNSGHLYLLNFLKTVKSLFVEDLQKQSTAFLKYIEIHLDDIFNDIRENWQISFKPWYNTQPKFPLRVKFNKWKILQNGSDSQILQRNILTEIDKVVAVLDLTDQMFKDELDFTDLREGLKDQTKREDLKNPRGARRCLYTLISQDNIWNFSHARVFVENDAENYYLVQDSSGSQFRDKIADLDNFDREHIEDTASMLTKKAYIANVSKLQNKLNNDIDKIKLVSY